MSRRSRRASSARRCLRGASTGLWSLAVIVGLCSCTEDPAPPTAAELLSELEGRELSTVEQNERLEVMGMLCDLDAAVLVELWDRLDDDQLAFQDIAFSRTCPERIQLYADETGRFASDG